MQIRFPVRAAVCGLALLLASTTLFSAEPKNLYLLKQEIKAYVKSGEYDQGLAAVAADAKAWLEQRVKQGGPKLAVVFDIDETLLKNLPHILSMDFGYLPDKWDAWVDQGIAPPIEPVCDLLRTAQKLGVAVFVITGRHEKDQPGTEKNFAASGIANVTGIYFKPAASPESTGEFKTATRKKITEEGYTIVLNIGDQEIDLNGGYAEKTFKLPNPFYIIPDKFK